jgi:autophagy-related protein 9
MDHELIFLDYNQEWHENNSLLQNRYDFSDEMIQELNRDEFAESDNNKKCYMNIFGKKQNTMKADLFYCNLYEYYYRGGFLTIILSYILEIFSLIFGIHFMIFIFILLDWNKILQCGKENDIQDCGEIYIYINPKYPNFFCFLFLVFACLFTFYKISLFLSNYKYILITRDFFENKLKISSSELQTMKWYNIIKKISSYNNISIEDITNIILKKENYIIALINENIINISPSLYTKQLELNLKYILFNDIENINKIKNINTKFILFGILNLFFSVFIFIYHILYFFISNVDEIASNKYTFGDRTYTLFAKRKFRNYNEYKHYFKKRLNKSLSYSNEYIKQFPSPLLEILGKFIGLVSGAFIGLFLIFSLLDESIILYVRFLDRSLIFYMGIFGAISAASRGLIKSPSDSIYNPEDIMKKVSKYTYYMPFEWNNKCNTYYVRNEFLKMFKYKIFLFLNDLLSVITTPIILIFVLPKQSEKIINFLINNTVYKKESGNNCVFSQFKNINNKKMELSISMFNENNSEFFDETNY